MKQLSRKKIQDMIDLNGANISSRRSSGGSGAGGGGGVSSAWVDEHYVSKDFFARLFTINGTDENDDDVVVEPNDLETTITNIQAMVGLWTEEYLSALGQGSGGGGGGGALLTEPLASINETGMGTPSGANKVIAWNGSTWTYMPYTTGSGTVTSVTMTVPTGFKVSNGDTQTINNSGTFALTFGGTITKNQVLASPAAANGTPAWRALVADDIPTLTAAKISDITLTNGTLTIGNNSITPITDTTLKSDYSWWGQALNNDGAVTGDITVGNGSVYLNNGKNIICKDSDGTNRSVIGINTSNLLRIGYGHSEGGTDHETVIYGSKVKLYYYDTSRSFGVVLDNNGNVGIGATSPLYKLHVNGYTRTKRLYLTDSVYLEYDSSNSGVHLVGAGLYTDTYVSALGAGSGGGGGSTTLTEPLASINEAGMGSPSGTNKVIVYTSSGWSYMPYTNGGSGSVTSVGLSMPTGFNVTGTPVTGSGTLAVTFGGSVAKNKVLAAPSSAAGTPDWRTLVAADIPELSYLPLTGGMLSIAADGFIVRRNSTGANSFSSVTFYKGTSDDNQTMLGRLGFKTVDTPVFRDVSGNYYTLYHEGNLSTSGTAFAATKLTTVSKTAWGRTYWTSDGVPTNVSGTITVGNGDIVMNNNKYIYFTDSPSEGSASLREVLRLSNSNYLLIGYGTAAAGYTTRIYGDAIGFRYGTSGTQGMVLRRTGHLTINANDDTDATRNIYLNVGGNVKATKFYFTNSVYLEYNSSNSGVHLVGAGLYADTYISSLGAGSGGGSGSGITMADVWSAMATPAPSTAQEQIEASHLSQALSGYATRTWANNRFVTQGTTQTITGNKSFTGNLSFGSGGKLTASNGAKFQSVCIECNDSGSPADRTGEINRYSGQTLHLQYDSGTGGVSMCQNKLNVTYNSSTNRVTFSEDSLFISAQTFAGSVAYTYSSDIRLKDVINPVTASVEDIANVRIFDFRWKKDGENGNIHFGSAAQDWQTIFPHAVVADKEGFLSMDYAGIAVGAVKTVAQEVVLLKKRVTELEKQLKAS